MEWNFSFENNFFIELKMLNVVETKLFPFDMKEKYQKKIRKTSMIGKTCSG